MCTLFIVTMALVAYTDGVRTNMETLEDLKAIRDNAPDGATIVDIENDGFIDYLYCDTNAPSGEKIKSCSNGGDSAIEYSNGNIRSLSDIERIIKQREMLELAWKAIGEAGYEDYCNELRDYMEALK